ncbi:MAG: DUF433 domain-containing protein [Anaerolineae bacterium]|nr:DUF433 domain-containing protein [Anaerolineae bacterium]
MIDTPVTEQIPIRADEDGRLRVGATRILLDLVIYAFRLGSTPETITEQYPSLSLDDVYLAIGYYLRHRDEVDAYLREQESEAEAFRREYEAGHPPTLTRDVLLARLESRRSPG